MMDLKLYGRKWLLLHLRCKAGIFIEGLRTVCRTLVRIVGVTDEVCTGHILFTDQRNYCMKEFSSVHHVSSATDP
jgi:hypothetical protein